MSSGIPHPERLPGSRWDQSAQLFSRQGNYFTWGWSETQRSWRWKPFGYTPTSRDSIEFKRRVPRYIELLSPLERLAEQGLQTPPATRPLDQPIAGPSTESVSSLGRTEQEDFAARLGAGLGRPLTPRESITARIFSGGLSRRTSQQEPEEPEEAH